MHKVQLPVVNLLHAVFGNLGSSSSLKVKARFAVIQFYHKEGWGIILFFCKDGLGLSDEQLIIMLQIISIHFIEHKQSTDKIAIMTLQW